MEKKERKRESKRQRLVINTYDKNKQNWLTIQKKNQSYPGKSNFRAR